MLIDSTEMREYRIKLGYPENSSVVESPEMVTYSQCVKEIKWKQCRMSPFLENKDFSSEDSSTIQIENFSGKYFKVEI